MVCLGNICRSPLAEGVLRQKLNDRGITGIEVDSCGTSGWHNGEAPDVRTIENALTHNVDLRDIRSRRFELSDFNDFDIIYTMDESNHTNVVAMASSSEDASKVKMLLNEISPESNSPVPDPYFGSDGFENVYQLVNQACDKICDNLESNG